MPMDTHTDLSSPQSSGKSTVTTMMSSLDSSQILNTPSRGALPGTGPPGVVAFARNERDTAGARKAESKDRGYSFVCLVVICSVVFILVSATAVSLSSIANCSEYDQKKCFYGGATCSRLWWKPHCYCVVATKTFLGSTCQSPCESNLKGICPKGICYIDTCFKDVFSLATYLYSTSCNGTNSGMADCSVTCQEVISSTCAANRTQDFCVDKHAISPKFKDFACQLNNTSGHFKGLSPSATKDCLKDLACRPLMQFYPCLTGYVVNSRVLCSKRCVAPREKGTALAFYGHCFLKRHDCEQIMERLATTLEGNSFGYSYIDSNFDLDQRAWLDLTTFPKRQSLIYPIMLAYGALAGRKTVPVESVLSKVTPDDFFQLIREPDTNETLESLYTGQKNVVEELVELAHKFESENHTLISDDVVLRTAYLVGLYQCKALSNCPPLMSNASTTIRWWLRKGGGYCALIRALHAASVPFNLSTWNPLIRLWGAELTSVDVTVLYSPSFLPELIDKVGNVVRMKRLDGQSANITSHFCNVSEAGFCQSSVVLPLNLLATLRPQKSNDNSIQPDSVQGFALVVASIWSVKKALCGEIDKMPSADCELRLYLAFLAFLPKPDEHEARFIGSNDTALVYFALRWMARAQLSHGTRKSPFNTSHKETSNISQVQEAAKMLVERCLEKLPDGT